VVGGDEQLVAEHPDHAVVRVRLVEERVHRPDLAVDDRRDVDPVGAVGAAPHLEDEPAPVVAHVGVEAPLWLVGPLVDDDVGGGVRAEPVQLQPLVADRRRVLLSRRRGVVRAVEEPGAVRQPRGGGELRPADLVRQPRAGGGIDDPPGQPVGAGVRAGEGDQRAVASDRHVGQ
jgi:hypothetical protein